MKVPSPSHAVWPESVGAPGRTGLQPQRKEGEAEVKRQKDSCKSVVVLFFGGQLQLPTDDTSKHWGRNRCGVGAGRPPKLQGLGSLWGGQGCSRLGGSRRWGRRSPPPAAPCALSWAGGTEVGRPKPISCLSWSGEGGQMLTACPLPPAGAAPTANRSTSQILYFGVERGTFGA